MQSFIEKVIVDIGIDQISAVVSDNASNVKKVREIIQDKFPTIKNVRCITHCINLIACDIVKEEFGDRNSKLTQLIKKKRIVGGGLKLYCKIRWTTASESVNSVINLEQILMEIVANNGNLLTNDSIARIIQSQNFFLDLQILAFVLEPLRKVVLALEVKSATLADCFLSLAKLAAVLNKLPKLFNSHFHSHCVKIINERFNEFDDDKYITYEEDPFDLDLSIAKQSPLNWWKLIATDPKPELLPKVTCHLLSICPNSATCERGFSTLGWLFERRLNLKLTTLESMYI
ncbi:hypothetical protein RhiirB3_457051 [Rhizophagus irregularis]|nr:hypothetical protein RhiirB3_457051 [Rhizophagus irregularis]